jgi:hypothetical protein
MGLQCDSSADTSLCPGLPSSPSRVATSRGAAHAGSSSGRTRLRAASRSPRSRQWATAASTSCRRTISSQRAVAGIPAAEQDRGPAGPIDLVPGQGNRREWPLRSSDRERILGTIPGLQERLHLCVERIGLLGRARKVVGVHRHRRHDGFPRFLSPGSHGDGDVFLESDRVIFLAMERIVACGSRHARVRSAKHRGPIGSVWDAGQNRNAIASPYPIP